MYHPELKAFQVVGLTVIDGLGPGQLVGRQVLASPALGEIQLSLCDRRGNLEVEVIRARGLQCKPGSKVLPGIYTREKLRYTANISTSLSTAFGSVTSATVIWLYILQP